MQRDNLLMYSASTRGGVWLHEVVGVAHAVYSCTKPFFLTTAGTYDTFLDDLALKDKAYTIADKLAWRNNGESKFLRMIMANMEIRAPRAWWSHYDTYKIGTVAQSESTMHALSKRDLLLVDCEIGTSIHSIQAFNEIRDDPTHTIDELKYALPEGFLQSRVVTISYAALQTAWYQRHVQERLGWWKTFLTILPLLPHSQWLYKTDDSKRNRFRE